MRKFKFRLQGLEDIKGMEFDALRQAFAAAREELKRSEGNLLNARAAQDSTYHELAIERTAQADPLILLSLESYGVLLRDQVRALTQKVAQQRRELQAAQDRLAAKYKEKKALEKFHERKSAEYNQYVERELQKELDETAQNMHQAGGA